MDAFRLVYDIRFCRVDISCSGVQYLWFCFFCFCCVLFCVFVVASLVVLLVVLEFENGSREEEFLLFSMSQRGDFRMVGVACVALRAVRLIC